MFRFKGMGERQAGDRQVGLLLHLGGSPTLKGFSGVLEGPETVCYPEVLPSPKK